MKTRLNFKRLRNQPINQRCPHNEQTARRRAIAMMRKNPRVKAVRIETPRGQIMVVNPREIIKPRPKPRNNFDWQQFLRRK